jgi:hypothetical protein
MGQILYFGGREPQRVPSVSLNTLNAHRFQDLLFRWVGNVYATEPDVPVLPEELLAFDEWALIPRFRADYDMGRMSVGRGMTLEEMVLSAQLLLRQSVMCLIARAYADQPSSRIPRKRYVEADKLALLLAHNLRNWEGAAIQALVYDGQSAHSIVVTGTSTAGEEIRYRDPWPTRSLLCADQNAAGVDAVADSVHLGEWLISTEDFARVLVAVVVSERIWRWWQDDLSAAALETPFDPRKNWDGWRPEASVMALQNRLGELNAQPGSRQALASAAYSLAVITAQRHLSPNP